jgi:hypothetical protein
MGRSKGQSRQEEGRTQSVSCQIPILSGTQLTISGSFRSGIKPLGMKNEIRHAIKNLSEDLPPISDIEQMFDHLVSRVGHYGHAVYISLQ